MAHETNELDRRLRRLGEHLEAERVARSMVARSVEAPEDATPHWVDGGTRSGQGGRLEKGTADHAKTAGTTHSVVSGHAAPGGRG